MNTNEGSDKVTVGSLLREGLDDQQVLAKLRDKYPDNKDLVRKMYDEWEEQNNRVRRKARKFAELILTRYNHLGPKRIMEKARKFKAKYGFSEDEFQAFVNIALSDRALSQVNLYNAPNTPMGKTLGQMDTSMAKMNVKPTELDVLQEILRMHQDNSMLHTQVVLQSLTYYVPGALGVAGRANDIPIEVTSGQFDVNRHNVLTHVHPVVAALFIPRIKYLDEHMLIGSISSIVSARHQNMPIKDRPTWELYWDIITDPNEIACVGNKDSSLTDLRNRVVLQVELWKSVKNLRQGRFFDPEVAGFLGAVDRCRNYVFDSADYMLVKDEGTILRRLLGAFSLRPTIVSINPAQGILTALGVSSGAASFGYPLTGNVATQVATIPVINLRIPFHRAPTGAPSTTTTPPATTLVSGIDQVDMYVENRMIVQKKKEVMYSRDVLFFYINRRYQSFNFTTLTAPYLSLNNLPVTTSGFETLNAHEVIADETLSQTIGGDTFEFRSAVSITTAGLVHRDPAGSSVVSATGSGAQLITGCRAYIRSKADSYFEYDPIDTRSRAVAAISAASSRRETALIPAGLVISPTGAAIAGGSWGEVEPTVRTNGTIFVYEKRV
jgi:hypothetical protein